ncbi:SpoIIE family protein phosphatase [Natranaerofaba carboxydovora]|uniref:SpoIIE family protein phosphatase n=1 Tax=Natranaerofaba carboxydovora TaxID=2742683 RepID=UPI001F1409EF|nr:SpoIIE family protein phosphatase [Natranaerofaba carboxydovora]UMZ73999.1 Phosphoserine phosphatase RsbU [Natranaerofaba carboxydovora]
MRESSEIDLFKNAIEAFNHPFLIINVEDYTILEANSASGIFKGEKTTCYALKHSRNKPCKKEICPLEIIKETKQPTTVEHIHYDDNGNQCIVEVHAYPIFGEDGKVIQIIEYIFDITERKRTEKSLIRFRNALDSSGDSIFIIAYPSFRLIDVNKTACIELGYEKEELLSLKFFDIKPYMSKEEIIDKFKEVMNCSIDIREGYQGVGCAETFETQHLRKDGSVFPVEVSIHVSDMTSESNELLFVATARDITERKEAELKLSEYAEKLETEFKRAKKIHERTFLSEIPKIEGVSLEAHFYPAQRLGGDFYNIIKVNNKLLIYLADVSGHGLDGTIITTFVKETIESYISFKPDKLDPKLILEHINKQYRKDNYPYDYFLCIFLAVLDLDTFELCYTGTGMQFTPLVRLGNGEIITLNNEGLPISSAVPAKFVDFTPSTIKLSPGSTVLFFTDGIAEQEGNKSIYEENLKEIFYSKGNLPPEVLKHIINDDFCKFNNGSLQGEDDITYVIMQLESGDKKEYSFEFKSDKSQLDKLSSEVYPIINAFSKENVSFQGLYELVTNAIEHGNKENAKKKVYIDIIITGEYIVAIVEDEGKGFDWLEKKTAPLDLEHSGERGRGIILTQMLCDSLYYNEKGNKAFLIMETK